MIFISFGLIGLSDKWIHGTTWEDETTNSCLQQDNCSWEVEHLEGGCIKADQVAEALVAMFEHGDEEYMERS